MHVTSKINACHVFSTALHEPAAMYREAGDRGHGGAGEVLPWPNRFSAFHQSPTAMWTLQHTNKPLYDYGPISTHANGARAASHLFY